MSDEFTYSDKEIAEGTDGYYLPDDRPSGRYARAIPSSAIPKKQQHWLIPDMIPLNTLTVFGGIGGEGKSSMMLDIAAKLSRGDLDGDVKEPASTLILSVEDDWATQMGPRLEAAGANEDLVYKSVVESYIAESGTTTETKAVLPLDLTEIAHLVREIGAKLLVFDPAMSFMDGDPNKAIDVRRAFDPVSTLAQNLDIAVLLIAHFNKGGSSVGAKLSGSHAWRDLTRSYWGFAKDNETGKRVFSSDKGNYSKADGLSFEFDIVSRDVFIEGVPKSYGAVANIQATDLTVGELIDREREGERGDSSTEVDECKEWLLDLLDREPFDMPRKSVVAAAKAEGFSTATLNRARAKAGVWTTSTKTFPTTSVWGHPRIAPIGETTETTGETENVSPGQNSYRTVISPEEERDDCETTGLTRDDARQHSSHLSHLTVTDTAEGPVDEHSQPVADATPESNIEPEKSRSAADHRAEVQTADPATKSTQYTEPENPPTANTGHFVDSVDSAATPTEVNGNEDEQPTPRPMQWGVRPEHVEPDPDLFGNVPSAKTTQPLEVLSHLCDHGPAGPAELTAAIPIIKDSNAASSVLTRLKNKSHVHQQEDGRYIITEAGLEYLTQVTGRIAS